MLGKFIKGCIINVKWFMNFLVAVESVLRVLDKNSRERRTFTIHKSLLFKIVIHPIGISVSWKHILQTNSRHRVEKLHKLSFSTLLPPHWRFFSGIFLHLITKKTFERKNQQGETISSMDSMP